MDCGFYSNPADGFPMPARRTCIIAVEISRRFRVRIGLFARALGGEI
jgi:hypothetical protein